MDAQVAVGAGPVTVQAFLHPGGRVVTGVAARHFHPVEPPSVVASP
jgi:hypothetical protein